MTTYTITYEETPNDQPQTATGEHDADAMTLFFPASKILKDNFPRARILEIKEIDTTPEPEPDELGPGCYHYTPEMGEAKPAAEIEARLSHYGQHYFLRTPLTLRESAGCKLIDTYNPISRPAETWHRYRVTIREFEKIKNRHSVSFESLLD